MLAAVTNIKEFNYLQIINQSVRRMASLVGYVAVNFSCKQNIDNSKLSMSECFWIEVTYTVQITLHLQVIPPVFRSRSSQRFHLPPREQEGDIGMVFVRVHSVPSNVTFRGHT